MVPVANQIPPKKFKTMNLRNCLGKLEIFIPLEVNIRHSCHRDYSLPNSLEISPARIGFLNNQRPSFNFFSKAVFPKKIIHKLTGDGLK